MERSTERQTTELLDRLEELQRELSALRREVHEPLYASSQLPSTDFRALRFRLGNDDYGIPVAWVREIVRYVSLTAIGDAPHGVAGGVNVRGVVLAVIDTRMRLGMAPTVPNLRTSIVLVSMPDHDFGILVDSVVDVANVPQACVTQTSSRLTRSIAVQAVATLGDRVVQLLDVARLLTEAQWETLPASIAPVTTDASARG